MSNSNNTDDLSNLQTTIENFEGVLKTKEANRGSLWLAWHYLQIYTVWGLRLPTTEAALVTSLGIDKDADKDKNDPLKSLIHQPGTYSFFPAMLSSYQKVYAASDYFHSTLFPKIVLEIGSALKNFAKTASSDGEAVFSAILKLLKQNNTDAALELLSDLQNQADENVKKAEDVATQLSTYSTMLANAQSELNDTNYQIGEDSRVNAARIAQLEGDATTSGSVESLKALISLDKAEYQHDVVIATTTPTYAWVGFPFFPVGLISAAIVAAIYGDKALKMLAEIERQEAILKSADQELQIAKAVQAIQATAGTGVDKAREYTDTAIEQTNIVKNAWLNISTSLEAIKNKLSSMVSTADGDTKLRAILLVETYADIAGKRWAELMPAVSQLTDNPYIIVKREDVSISELIAQVTADMNANPSNN